MEAWVGIVIGSTVLYEIKTLRQPQYETSEMPSRQICYMNAYEQQQKY